MFVPKQNLFVNNSSLIVIDPTNSVTTNVTPTCFMATEIFQFFVKFEERISEYEAKLLEYFKINKSIGKFRDIDLEVNQQFEKKYKLKSQWLVQLFGLDHSIDLVKT